MPESTTPPGPLILPFAGSTPKVHPTAFIAPGATLIGNVTVEENASVWFGAVLRGDDPRHGIVVGPRTSVQDTCVVHVGAWQETRIGGDCTIGHGAAFESCTIEDGCVVGMNAVILQGALIGEGSIVAAGSVVLEDTHVPPGSLVAGVPARVKKSIEGSSADWTRGGGSHYVALSRRYLTEIGGLPRCELCDGPLLDRHCKILCLNCGYQRDCSDP